MYIVDRIVFIFIIILIIITNMSTLFYVFASEQTSQRSSRLWIADLFSKAENSFKIDNSASKTCRDDYEFYKKNLRNNSIWAVQMSESSEWPRKALLTGRSDYFGHHEECLMVETSSFQGQYCILEWQFDLIEAHEQSTPIYPFDQRSIDDLEGWDAIHFYENDKLGRFYRTNVRWSVCVPSTCSESDVTQSIIPTLQSSFQHQRSNISLKIRCEIKEKGRGYTLLRNTIIIFGCYFVFLMFLITIAIIVRGRAKEDDLKILAQIVDSLSIKTTYRKLIHVDSSKTNHLFIHTIRYLFSIGAIIFHQLASYIMIRYSAEPIESVTDKIRYSPITFEMGTDFLYFLSGFFMVIASVERIHHKGLFGIFINITRRWFRLFPPFIILMALYMYSLPHAANGPSNVFIKEQAEQFCKPNFLSFIFLHPDTVSPDMYCFPSSWVVIFEIYFVIIGNILLWIVLRYRILGSLTWLLSILVAIIWPIVKIVKNQYHGRMLMDLKCSILVRDFENEFITTYAMPTARFMPYISGICTSFLVGLLKKRMYKFSKMQIILLTILPWIVYACTFAYSFKFLEYDRAYYTTERSIFFIIISASRVLIAAGAVCIYFVNNINFDKYIPNFILILSKLSYCLNAVNVIVITFYILSQRNLNNAISSTHAMIEFFLIGLIYTHVAAIIIYFTVEAPLQRIAEVILRSRSK